MQRTPEEIIADYLDSFDGGDGGAEHWKPYAVVIIRWLRDEGWIITRKEEL